MRSAGEDHAAPCNARSARPRHLCAQLFQDAVGEPAGRFYRLRTGYRQRAGRHQDADQHHYITIHRAFGLSDAGERHYHKYLLRLHERLAEARLNVVQAFERIGLELFVEPRDGMFVWARFPQIDDSLALAEASQGDGIMLAPGAVFRPHLERSPWMRFNVAVCDDTRVQRWLEGRTQGESA